MKTLKMLVVFILSLALIVSISCSSAETTNQDESSQQASEENSQAVTVNGNGNIEVGKDIMLTFQIGGQLERIYVIEGELVSEGDVLAELNKDSLELALNNARSGYNSARVAYLQAQSAVNQNELAVDNAKIAIAQAETALRTAEYNLEQTRELYTWTEISAAEGEIEDAEEFLESALIKLAQTPPGTESEKSWQKAVYYAQQRLNTAKSRFDALLSGTDIEEVAIKQQQVETTRQSLETAGLSLEITKTSLKLSIESEQLTRESALLAEEAVNMAENQLQKAVITAPFTARVASVNVENKTVVSQATVIFHLVDMDSLELNVEVDEIDIPQVRPGQKATIAVDALPDTPLTGTVRSVSLLPAQATGLIMYEVKISIDDAAKYRLKVGMSAAADIIVSK